MAIYFWDLYSRVYNSNNFGDDINPAILKKLFKKEIIESDRICIVGIGTLIDSDKMDTIKNYEKKIIFSSGAGYGSRPDIFDSSWEVACVRGPVTCEWLGLDVNKAITDGAVLLDTIFSDDAIPESTNVKPSSRNNIVFVPHIRTHWRIGNILKEICFAKDMVYLPPDQDPDRFVRTIRESDLALCEAMHGAIVADTVRTPWVCCSLLYHNEFKWRDWCASVDVSYNVIRIPAQVAWIQGPLFERGLRRLARPVNKKRLENELGKARHAKPSLSDASLLADKKGALWDAVAHVNATYS